MTFGEMVKEVRGRLQLTQKELAAELDVGYYEAAEKSLIFMNRVYKKTAD